ncbi:MAG: hypothetical protein AAFO07_19575 [Bacteroidota bacterium]
MELIISSILLLIIGSSDDYIKELVNKYGRSEIGIFIGLLIPILLFIKTNLVVHIFFRGLWIACIGLRYVSDDIDFEKLSYTERFNRFLKNRVKSFDNYIERLERMSSIIFSYSFLMVFHFISFCLFNLFLFLLGYLLSEILSLPQYIAIFALFIFLFAGILNFIDFMTLGLLKKYKWASFLFYPFYRVYNLFSLSFLYRPLHYNFIDNSLGQRYMLFMIPYMFLLLIFNEGISIGSYNYMPTKEQNLNWVIGSFYDDLRNNEPIEEATINKFIYQSEPLQLFIPYKDDAETEKCLARLCPDFTSYGRRKYELNAIKAFMTGFKEGAADRKTNEYRDSVINVAQNQADRSIDCIRELYDISIDSLAFTSKEFIFYQHPNFGEKGILTVIDISSLANGKHTIVLKTKTNYKDDEYVTETIEIPFFKKGVMINSAN